MFFLVWGSDQASVDAGLDDARTAGKIVDVDIVVTGVWPAEAGPQPPTRWVLHFNGKSQLSEDERDILCDIAQDRARIGPAETDRTVVMGVCRGHKHAATDYSKRSCSESRSGDSSAAPRPIAPARRPVERATTARTDDGA
jgi:hypothetical protein